MTIFEFPPLETADEYGLLAVGGDLEVSSLLLAYRSGIFPWPIDNSILAWFSPHERAVLFFDEFHISRSLKREIRKNNYTVTFNKMFPQVISLCAKSRKGLGRKTKNTTWITEPMISAFVELHNKGFAYSVECLSGEELVGGVYGVKIGGMFSAESMFYLEPNASKVALVYLVNYLTEHGVSWLDCQVINPFTRSIGVREISREDYLVLLARAVTQDPMVPLL